MTKKSWVQNLLVCVALFAAFGTGGAPAWSAERQSGADIIPVDRDKERDPSNERQRQENIKTMQEYFAAEREFLAEQERTDAAWAVKENRERWRRERRNAPPKKPLTPEQEAKRQRDIKALREYYAAEKELQAEQDRARAAWGDKSNREKWKNQRHTASKQWDQRSQRPVALPPFNPVRRPPRATGTSGIPNSPVVRGPVPPRPSGPTSSGQRNNPAPSSRNNSNRSASTKGGTHTMTLVPVK